MGKFYKLMLGVTFGKKPIRIGWKIKFFQFIGKLNSHSLLEPFSLKTVRNRENLLHTTDCSNWAYNQIQKTRSKLDKK